MTYNDRNRAALDQLEDLLDAYADARLMPTAPVLARIRANVLAEAAARAAANHAMAEVATESPVHIESRRFLWTRRVAALGMAATMALGVTGAVMAAPPGSALYNARISIGNLALPSQPDWRLATRENHLEDRLDEAQSAATRGDAVGLAAALAAYEAEVSAALAELSADPVLLAHLEAMLAKHTTTLTDLEAQLPEQASIDKAIEASSKAIEKVKEKSRGQGGPPADPGNPNPNQGRP